MTQRALPKSADLALMMIGAVIALSALLMATSELTAMLVAHHWLALRDGPAVTAARVLMHLTNPPSAFDAAATSPIVYWAVTAAVGILLATGSAFVRAMFRRHLSTPSRGMATPRDLGRELRGPGLALGRDVATHRPLRSRYEDSHLVIAPPRAGKTSSVVIPNLIDFPGAAIATSTRSEVYLLTAHHRPGPVYLFDPTQFVVDAPRIGFDPIQGCADPLTAILVSRAFVYASHAGRGVANADYWTGQASKLLRCLFLAAACSGGDIRCVLGWLGDADTHEVARVLHNAGTAPTWIRDWSAIKGTPPRERASIYNSARHAMECFADPRVVEACCPRPGEGIDFARVLKERATVYVAADSRSQETIAALIAALVERLVDVARRTAARAPGGRLSVPLGLFLDEAPQIAPIPSLPAIMADGGGTGITTLVVLQSLSQARHRWGDHAADVIWNAATAKLILGGIAEHEDLERISRLCGELDEPTRSINRDGQHSSETIGTRRVRALEPASLRQLQSGEALLLYRRLRPIRTRLHPWWEGPYAKEISIHLKRSEQVP